ncbi:MAG: penicillin-insensitive murein endopeptidase [Nannocystis sp.]|nr:penicillin-insensitive murein endopeptidase [Nannocystis sp.]
MERSIVIRIYGLIGEPREEARVGSRWLIGAAEDASIQLRGIGVAAHHAVIEATEGGLMLHDLVAGTFVDDLPIRGPTRLNVGDRVGIGAVILEIYRDQAATRSSARRSPRRAVLLGSAVLIAVLIAAAIAGGGLAASLRDDESGDAARAARGAMTDEPTTVALRRGAERRVAREEPLPIRHEVLPGETSASIAARYGASLRRLLADNNLDPELPLRIGSIVSLRAVNPPLPRQRLRVALATGSTWSALQARYGLSRAEIQAQNPGLGADLPAGSIMDLWVDPQIHRRRAVAVDEALAIDPSATSIGAPNRGALAGGIQLPASPFYLRRNPAIMYGSSHTLRHLYYAIIRFRRSYGYRGELIVADLSRPAGGVLRPHHSHQSGRDVDLWMPSLGGAYLEHYLELDRRPHPEEINWLATWGLIESLLATREVQEIFLDGSLHERLYRAGEVMGASVEELAAIQRRPDNAGPRPPGAAIMIWDASGHTGHVHVRFRCARDELRCVARSAATDAP